MEGVVLFGLLVVGFLALGALAMAFGVDSREGAGDSYQVTLSA